jgi:GAF domain-containing protein
MSDARILVVDADDSTRQSTADDLAGQLADIETHVERVGTLEEARSALSGGVVDCVVTEIDLPDGTGYGLLEWIRTESPHTAGIIYSDAAEDEVERLRSEGVVAEFVSKDSPASIDLLARLVRTTVETRTQTSYPLPQEEHARLAALETYNLGAAPLIDALERVTDLASRHLECSAASVNVVGNHEQEFYACHGSAEGWESTPREDAICTFTILGADSVMTVGDVQADPRFAEIETLADLGIRAYIGADLTTAEGFTIGTLCAYDDTPREFTPEDEEYLRVLADVAMDLIGAFHEPGGEAVEETAREGEV